MSFTVDSLERLLPAVHRVRDAEGGGELRGLLEAIAATLADLEEEIEQLYDDQFIETAGDAVVPYIAELVGARVFALPTEKDEASPARSAAAVRAQVADAIRNRRRRGTAAGLEQVARDITGWDTLVVEFFLRLALNHSLRHDRLGSPVTADLRDVVALDRVGTPFESVTRTIDVRRIATGRGTHNIPNVGVFLWPFRGERSVLVPAFEIDTRRYLFDPLGTDVPLRTLPVPERDPAGLARPLNVPLPITRRAMDASPVDYFGNGRSIVVEMDGNVLDENDIVVADLSNIGADDASGWSCDPPQDVVAIDPALGRIAFSSAAGTALPVTLRVSCSAGHRTGVGGGAYERAASFRTPGQVLARVPDPVSTLPTGIVQTLNGGTVEIIDSSRYADSFLIAAGDGAQIELRGANGQRPHLALPADLEIDGDGAEVWLNGLLITEGAILVRSGVARVHIRHCTLVPGRGLTRDGTPADPTSPSIIVEGGATSIEIESSIAGGIRAAPGTDIRMRYSIIDATSTDGIALSNATQDGPAGGLVTEQCTIVGKVWAGALDVSNSIVYARLATGDAWTEALRSERRQSGCVRFSWVPPGSITPKRYRCQPDSDHPGLEPRFRTLRYGRADYALLTHDCAPEIAEGADDGGEMGAFVRLRLRQRESNLRAALPENVRFGMEAGTFVSLR